MRRRIILLILLILAFLFGILIIKDDYHKVQAVQIFKVKSLKEFKKYKEKEQVEYINLFVDYILSSDLYQNKGILKELEKSINLLKLISYKVQVIRPYVNNQITQSEIESIESTNGIYINKLKQIMYQEKTEIEEENKEIEEENKEIDLDEMKLIINQDISIKEQNILRSLIYPYKEINKLLNKYLSLTANSRSAEQINLIINEIISNTLLLKTEVYNDIDYE